MAVPDPAFTSDNINDAGVWTPSGSPEVADDLFNPGASANFDGVDDVYDHGSQILTSGTTGSFSCWVRTSVANTTDIMNDYDVAGGVGWYIRTRLGGIQVSATSVSSGNFRRSTTSTQINNGVWRHVIGVVASTADVDIFFEGVEASYSEQNLQGGTGFAGWAPTAATVLLGDNDNSSQPFTGNISRPRVWAQGLTSDQALEVYNNEIAILMGDDSGIYPNAINPALPTAIGKIY